MHVAKLMRQRRERHHHPAADLTFNTLCARECLHLNPVAALQTRRTTDARAGIHQQSNAQFLSTAQHYRSRSRLSRLTTELKLKHGSPSTVHSPETKTSDPVFRLILG